ncbi:(R,R)-butanediol dehydrogenase/meso-butanediol dehydrogenase/diacetyl reductase [Actinocorallia herbida]|uniref:(R,R)-butanediol dehydrogenase/meso-butanediol dehydrogenase/diacetyl reductase n=1 Tax=Actinocorallia herbida TaxID=58109 RepID=A0A3N1D157_9ACTN|nr:zinc-binding dehydrogenase [Actinocorallia herbida]ROO87267.1 (R,R)-butanediol dehydrogenase/meso-butanediol dehydrogenase/diacetyl reductase [Actinocorallia herbida]
MSDIAYVITGAGELTAVPAADTTAVKPGYAVVEVAFCGICGSDVESYRKGIPLPPSISGHEWGGTVISVGEGVESPAPGDRVSKTSAPSCGKCPLCRAGHHADCDRFSARAASSSPATHGAYTRFVQVPASTLVKLPDNVTDEQGALVEPATVALHGVRLRQPGLGGTALVFGLGVIGLFAVQLASLSGAVNVVAVDPDPVRRDAALGFGAVAAFAPDDPALQQRLMDLTDARGADVAYECSGQASVLTSAVPLMRNGGALVLIGAGMEPVQLVPALWLSKGLDVQTSLAHTRDEFDITVTLLSRGLLKTKGMTGTTVGLSRLPEVFADLAKKATSLKVLVDPRG